VARRERKNEQASEAVFAVFADRVASPGHVQRAGRTASLESVIYGPESVRQLHHDQEEEKEEDDGRFDGGGCLGANSRPVGRFIHHDEEEKDQEERCDGGFVGGCGSVG